MKKFSVFSFQFSVFLLTLLTAMILAQAQFVDRITRPCAAGATPRALVITNPNSNNNVEVTTCVGGSLLLNGAAIIAGGAVINPTNGVLPYRSAAGVFSDSPLTRTSATVLTSTAAFLTLNGGVNNASFSFASEPTLGFFRGGAGQLSVTSAGTVGWFDTNGWHGFGTKVEVFNDTATSTDGFIATTNGNATVGVQKLSPRLRFSGSGWKTDTGGAAQMVDWIVENLPIQGTASPSTQLVFSGQINAGGYLPRFTLDSNGGFLINGTTSGAIAFRVPAVAGSNAVTFPAGTTDFSATGGASQFVRQNTAGGALTVVRPACADLSDAGAGCTAAAGAPALATYITQTPDAGLSAEQALSVLGTGVVKNTTGIGVLSIAVAGDFPTLNQNTSGTAAISSTSTVTDDTTTNATMFPLWVTTNTGNLPVKVTSSKFSFNPSTGTLTLTQFQGPTLGVSTNSNAGAGQVGEYVSATLAFASRVALTTATGKTVTSISLTAGDWDITPSVVFFPAATSSVTLFVTSVSTVNNGISGALDQTTATDIPGTVFGAPQFGTTIAGPAARFSLAATTTIYLTARSDFSISTMEAFGFIGARRVR